MSGTSTDLPVNDRQLIGRRIRIARKKASLTSAELARALSISRAQLYKYESGTDKMSASMLYNVGINTGIHFDILLNSPHSEEMIEMASAFIRIYDKRVRDTLFELVVAIGPETDASAL